MRKFLPALLLLLILLVGIPARAQSTARASLFALDASAFPTFSAALDVFDASGNFLTGLTPSQVTVFEDNTPITPSSLQERQPGTQFAVALDAGPAFAFRDAYAVSRLDIIMDVLQNWAGAHSDAFGDDLTLVPNGGTLLSHLAAASFLDALSAYQPDLQTLRSSLDNLSRALDMVAEPGGQTGMKRVVLYITSPPDAAEVPALQNLTQRAVSLDARVHVWIVTSTDFFSTSGATALKDLSIITGGTYALFSGAETLPDPEVYLTPLRHTYALTYPSLIRASGAHSLSVEISYSGGMIATEPTSFDLTVEPPNPILVSPPSQIVRQGTDLTSTDFTSFPPISQELEAIIEFPDGMERPLARTALYVDGVLADENTAQPFDRFTWDLSALTRSGDHILQVQATDSLGLEKTSLGLTVTVTVIQPERGFTAFLVRNRLYVVLGAVGAAAAALVVTLLLGRKRTKKAPRRRAGAKIDPLTAEVETEPVKTVRRPLRGRAASALKQTDAWLIRLKEDGQPVTAPPIPITAAEVTFGSDPLQSNRVLDDPSVASLHARLKFVNGQYILSDEKTVAGTWVNHELLSAPRPLRHGDVFQVGRIGYRFMLRRPPDTPAPRVIPLKK